MRQEEEEEERSRDAIAAVSSSITEHHLPYTHPVSAAAPDAEAVSLLAGPGVKEQRSSGKGGSWRRER